MSCALPTDVCAGKRKRGDAQQPLRLQKRSAGRVLLATGGTQPPPHGSRSSRLVLWGYGNACEIRQQLLDPLLCRGKCKDYFDASAFLSASMADCLLHSIRSASEVAFSRHACRSGDSPLLLQAAVSPVSNRRDRRAFMGCEQGCSCTSQGSTKKHQQLPDDPLLSGRECWVGGA